MKQVLDKTFILVAVSTAAALSFATSAKASMLTIGENFTGSTFSTDSPFNPPDLLSSTPTVANRSSFEISNPNTYGFSRQPVVNFGPSDGREALVGTQLQLSLSDKNTNAVLQSGSIGDPDHDYYYPSIAVNQSGNVVIGFNRSGLSVENEEMIVQTAQPVKGKCQNWDLDQTEIIVSLNERL